MKVQLNVSGTPDEIKEAIGALSTLGGVRVIVSTKEEKVNPYPGLNRTAAVKEFIAHFRAVFPTVDDVVLNLNGQYPLIPMSEWKAIISRLCNPKYSTHCINRAKKYPGRPGTDTLSLVSEEDENGGFSDRTYAE